MLNICLCHVLNVEIEVAFRGPTLPAAFVLHSAVSAVWFCGRRSLSATAHVLDWFFIAIDHVASSPFVLSLGFVAPLFQQS